ncbi:hypothetical protein [Mycolicibacterium llatzerense]|uniref:hypothetical protein n=1 Tax=Mycolicibacterium llatzerense TaxID=280871 RepID=UPI0021B5EC83|nr:hypothetical protein [Mycolicibacterium llatzerense]MCT7372734.1 hypothetical protein [Mycolicibacterium llatzerense]
MARTKKQTTPADFYVSFGGSHGQANVDEPERGEQVEYTVYGTVVERKEKTRGDGEDRTTLVVQVEAVWPKGTPRPDNANQPAMVDHTGQVNPDATADSGEGGGELIPTADRDKGFNDGEHDDGSPGIDRSNVVNFSNPDPQ